MQSANVQNSALGIKKPAPKTKVTASKVAASKVAASKVAKSSIKDGYDLSTKPSQEMLDRSKAIKDEEEKYPIVDEEWILFFCEYFQYIDDNIDDCLKLLPDNAPLKALLSKSQTLPFLEGGYDNELKNDEHLDNNIGYYNLLFTQFKEGTNKLKDCPKINLLLMYIGAAILRLAKNKESSIDNLINFYRRIAVILELAVYPEVFLFRFQDHNTAPGIWIRKQEYFGVIPIGERRDYYKRFDAGLRGFVRNYIRRLIIYMRVKQTFYPLAYENPYIWSQNPIIALQNLPLPIGGVYKYNEPEDDYHISSHDWKYIPDFLLQNDVLHSEEKDYIDPKEWNKPPPDWWIERTKKLLGFSWWKKGVDVGKKGKALEGTKAIVKWKQLNGILPGNYDDIAHIWDIEYKKYTSGKKFVATVAADDAEADAIAAKTAMSIGGNRSKSKSKAKVETVNKEFQLKKLPKTPTKPKTPKPPKPPKTPKTATTPKTPKPPTKPKTATTPIIPKPPTKPKTATKSSRKPRLATIARAITV
jgi:hypothetical protein